MASRALLPSPHHTELGAGGDWREMGLEDELMSSGLPGAVLTESDPVLRESS